MAADKPRAAGAKRSPGGRRQAGTHRGVDKPEHPPPQTSGSRDNGLHSPPEPDTSETSWPRPNPAGDQPPHSSGPHGAPRGKVVPLLQQGDRGQTSIQIVAGAMRYFSQHGGQPIVFGDMARALGTSERCMHSSFDRIRGMSTAEALLEHRLNRLFTSLSEQPRQGLRQAIRDCGLGQTRHVVSKFEQTFGIDMPLFLLTCRRAADDRLFRRQHPQDEALVLTP